MLRFVTLLALVASAGAGAAPVPPPSEKELLAKHWGKTEGDGAFELKGKELTLRSAISKPNRDFSWGEQLSVPRTARVVSGDFVITVCIRDASAPGKDVKHDTHSSETNAGLYVRGDASSLRYYLTQTYQRFNGAPPNPNLQRRLGIEANYPRGGASGSLQEVEDGKSTYLRLIRKDKALAMSYSGDGAKWSVPNNPFGNIEMSIPDEVTVGVFLAHSTYQISHATFDAFTVEKPKEKAKKE